jgi:hypothetical protein
VSAFLPHPVDSQIERYYHADMDARRHRGQPTGGSQPVAPCFNTLPPQRSHRAQCGRIGLVGVPTTRAIPRR